MDDRVDHQARQNTNRRASPAKGFFNMLKECKQCGAQYEDGRDEKLLKVWWIPQIPMKRFEVDVDSPEEGAKLLKILANYDMFQYENNIKPDYANTGGLIMFDGGEWVDWEDPLYGLTLDEYMEATTESSSNDI